MDFNPRELYDRVITTGEDWADKKAAYDLLDDSTKSVLAQLTGDRLPQEKSYAAAEGQARASSAFREHLAAVAAARRAFLVAQVRYDGAKMFVDLRRTQESNRRAEMRL